jgi:hypothetical protein
MNVQLLTYAIDVEQLRRILGTQVMPEIAELLVVRGMEVQH